METDEAEAIPNSSAAPVIDDGPKKRRKGFQRGFRSGVWSHFLRATDGQSAKCTLCSGLIRTKAGTTSGLLVHLRAKHKINARIPLPASRRKILNDEGPEGEQPSKRCCPEDEGLDKNPEEGRDGVDSSSDESSPVTQNRTVFLRPKVELEEIMSENSDDDGPGKALRVQLGDGQSQNQHQQNPDLASDESYRRVDDQEITLFSLRNKSNREMKDIILHLQYKCQATEIECQRVKTKLALLRLSHCQSKLMSMGQLKNGRITTHLSQNRSTSLATRRQQRNHSSADEDADPDSQSVK